MEFKDGKNFISEHVQRFSKDSYLYYSSKHDLVLIIFVEVRRQYRRRGTFTRFLKKLQLDHKIVAVSEPNEISGHACAKLGFIKEDVRCFEGMVWRKDEKDKRVIGICYEKNQAVLTLG